MDDLVNQFANFAAAAGSPPSESDGAVLAVRNLIRDGGYAPGDRLPPERELIISLDLSRATLRKALDALERDGSIWRHVGKGTFVGGRHNAPAGGILAELGQQLTPVRMMRARVCIEPAIAREAAINASAEAIARIVQIKERAADAQSWAEYETQDDLFHRAIASATDNALLLLLFDQLNHVRRTVAVGNVIRDRPRPPEGHSSFAEHDQISAAIIAHDPAAAQDAMRQHLGSVSARLFGEER